MPRPPDRRTPSPPPAPDAPEAPSAPSSLGALGAALAPFALLGALNVGVRQVPQPIDQLMVYGAVVGLLLLLSKALRSSLPRAQGVLLLGAALAVGVSHRDAIRHGRLWAPDAIEETVHLATGLGHLDAAAFGVGAIADRGLAPFARYVEKVDARSSEIDILASHLASVCESADHLCETASILRFVADEVLYRSDPRGEGDYVKSPQETLAANAGDCEDKSILLVSLLEALGNRTWLVFTKDHAWPLVCFDRPIAALWKSASAGRSAEWREQYMKTLSPHHDAEEWRRLVDAAVELRLDDKSCYAMEPTAAGSFLGVTHETREYFVAVDPIGKRTVNLRTRKIAVAPEEY